MPQTNPIVTELSQINISLGSLAGDRATANYHSMTRADNGELMLGSYDKGQPLDLADIATEDRAKAAARLREVADQIDPPATTKADKTAKS